MLTDSVGQEFRQGTEMTLVTFKAKDNTALDCLVWGGYFPLDPNQQPASTIRHVGRLASAQHGSIPRWRAGCKLHCLFALEVTQHISARCSSMQLVRKSVPCGTGNIAVVVFAKCTLPHIPLGFNKHSLFKDIFWNPGVHPFKIHIMDFVFANALENEGAQETNDVNPFRIPK